MNEVERQLALTVKNEDGGDAGYIGEALGQGVVALDHRIPRRMTLEKPVEPHTAVREAAQILEVIDRDDPQTFLVIGGLRVAQMLEFYMAPLADPATAWRVTSMPKPRTTTLLS